ncbi:MAG: HD domain-containing protein [Gammaproteobacteria bacterium]|nr:HD domain-containing protein [Gammaproteobacteria bacterium]
MLQAWGKTDKESGEFHPLAHHSMDVAAVFDCRFGNDSSALASSSWWSPQ